MNAHTHTRTHTHRLAQARMHAYAHTHTPVSYQGNETEEKRLQSHSKFLGFNFPVSVRHSTSVSSFKSSLKTFLFKKNSNLLSDCNLSVTVTVLAKPNPDCRKATLSSRQKGPVDPKLT